MEPLGAAASIIAVLGTTERVVKYLGAFKHAPKERQGILDKLSALSGMLFILKIEAEAPQDESWNATFRSLDLPNGPIQLLKTALKTLEIELTPAAGLKKLGKSIQWPFKEKQIKDILTTIEQQKNTLVLARQNDHTMCLWSFLT